ncbi:MAG: hypothetical protein WCH62_02700 [Candidatus Omnitrophota bacterium]
MKCFKLIITIIFLSTSLAFASVKIDLSEHGKDLMKAPFPARFKFSKVYRNDWLNSTYAERKKFLTQWHIDLANQAKEEARLAKEKARLERDLQRSLQQKKKAEIARLKAEERKARQEQRETKAEKRSFEDRIKSSQESLRQMQKSLGK